MAVVGSVALAYAYAHGFWASGHFASFGNSPTDEQLGGMTLRADHVDRSALIGASAVAIGLGLWWSNP